MPGEYTLAALAAPVAVLALEVAVLRTGLLRRPRFWLAVGMVLAFQVPVDGVLTMGSPPVVSYDPHAITGLRIPGRIPVEDFGFGLALTALTLLLWEVNRRRAEPGTGDRRRGTGGRARG